MAIDKLITQMISNEPRVRERSARQLGNSQSPDALLPLVRALYDPNRDVRRAVVEALGNLGDPRAIRPLLELPKEDAFYEEEEDWNIVAMVGPILVKFGPQVADELAPFENDILAMTVLAQLGDTRAFEPLMSIAQASPTRSESTDQLSAIQALGQLRDPRAVDFLITYIYDKRLGVAALQALGYFDDSRVISILTEQLYHALAPEFCAASARALDQIGTPQALASLTALCRDKLEPYRLLVLQLLSKSTRAEFAILFEQILHDPDDIGGWAPAIAFFWEKGRFPVLEKLKAEVPSRPASAIDAFIRHVLAHGQPVNPLFWSRT
jgi:HEAT repeat protein